MNDTEKETHTETGTREFIPMDLGHGTVIRLGTISEMVSDSRLQIDYSFIRRGRQSKKAINRIVERFVKAALHATMAEHTGNPKWKRRTERDRAWITQNINMFPEGQLEDDATDPA